MDRSGVNHQINAVNDVGCARSVEDLCTFFGQVICQCAFLGIRTGYGESLFQKNLGKTAHADTADTNKMYVNRFCKINRIHIGVLLFLQRFVLHLL